MPALNFEKRFAPLISNKQKTHTIRPERKRPIKQGDKLYLFTGMRTRNCVRLLEIQCTRITNIEITDRGVRLNNVFIDPVDGDYLARADGFGSYEEFLAYFKGRYPLPFVGTVISWA